MSGIAHNPDVEGSAVARLPGQYRDLPYWEKFWAAVSPSLQELEDAIYDVQQARDPAVALGAQLDQWGALLNEDREDLEDSEYRDVLKMKVLSNRSSGVLDFFFDIVERLATLYRVHVFNLYPMTVSVEYVVYSALTASMQSRLARLLTRAASAGRKVKVVEGIPGFLGFAGNPDAAPLGVGLLGGRTDDG